MTDLISRADAIEAVTKLCVDGYIAKVDGYFIPLTDALINTLSALPSADCIEFDFNKYQPRVRNKVKDGIPSAEADCSTCKHNDKDWDSVECDSCCGNNNHYESAEADMSEYADRLWKIAYERGKREASAKANPTVVRCKTMIPYGDFREWAKRIREDNPNVIVIPFDAEVASADTVSREEYEELYRKAKEVNEMANDILADFPRYKELFAVVRCKDCKWHKLTDNNGTEVCTNKQWDISMAVYPIISADDFCSYGERQEL